MPPGLVSSRYTELNSKRVYKGTVNEQNLVSCSRGECQRTEVDRVRVAVVALTRCGPQDLWSKRDPLRRYQSSTNQRQ